MILKPIRDLLDFLWRELFVDKDDGLLCLLFENGRLNILKENFVRLSRRCFETLIPTALGMLLLPLLEGILGAFGPRDGRFSHAKVALSHRFPLFRG